MTRYTQMGYKKGDKTLDPTPWSKLKSSGTKETPKGQPDQKADKVHKVKKRTNEDLRASELKRLWKRTKHGEKRRQFRVDARDSQMICFNCRKQGHRVSECTESKSATDRSSQATGICYKCGSTEHGSSKCSAKVPEGQYPFATCFICKETGHLSRQCPDNPRGLYPNGGCCMHCGSVEHLVRDCIERQKEQGIPNVRLHTIDSSQHRSVDADDHVSEEDDEEVKPKVVKRKGKKLAKKVVKF